MMLSIKIGRSSANDYKVDSPVVSGQHAVLVSEGGKVTLKDLNSTNGTFVNGQRITGTHELHPGDAVKLGNVPLDWEKLLQTPPVKKTIVHPGGGGGSLPADVVEKRLIGRDASANIRFEQSDVSSRHAYLCRRSNGDVLLVDNGSTNGTYVNGSKVDSATLRQGDLVLIAKKYRLDWESVFQPGKNRRKNTTVWWAAAGIAVTVLLAGVAWWLWGWQRPLEPSQIYAMYKKSVVMIVQNSAYEVTVGGQKLSTYLNGYSDFDYCYKDDEGKLRTGITGGSGTGFFISGDGKIMTNRHVVWPTEKEEEETKEAIKQAIQGALIEVRQYELASRIEVNYRLLALAVVRNDSYVTSDADLIHCSLYKKSTDTDLDIAIIQTNNKTTPADVEHPVDVQNGALPEDLVVGSKIYTLGFPQSFTIGQTDVGLEANNQSGEITQERGDYVYGHNITIHQGASGSPVFDEYGKFAGVVVSGFLGISQGYNHAVRPEPVKNFVNK